MCRRPDARGKSPFFSSWRRRSAFALLCGDFNVCFDERDVHRRESLSEHERFPHRPEDRAFRSLVAEGLTDLFRRHHGGGGHYTWYDYRAWMRRRDGGMRLDYVFGNAAAAAACLGAAHDDEVRGWPGPSDHLPVLVELDVGARGA